MIYFSFGSFACCILGVVNKPKYWRCFMTMARVRMIRLAIGVFVLAGCVFVLLSNPVSAAVATGLLG
jgi:hypothetical protein